MDAGIIVGIPVGGGEDLLRLDAVGDVAVLVDAAAQVAQAGSSDRAPGD